MTCVGRISLAPNRRIALAGAILLCLSLLPFSAARSAQPDWKKAQQEAVSLLQELIRTDTQNPPGNELAACRVLEQFFRREGIPVQIFPTDSNRANLTATLKGGGAGKPILLVAHTDVVPFDSAAWLHRPLSGELEAGYVWGRGAIDDKGMLTAEAMALALLKRSGLRLRRDLVLLATASEEAGGGAGIGWMVEHQPDLLDAAFALNEGGRIVTDNGKPLWVGIETEEKIAYNIKLTATGSTGHASVPREDNPIFALARALARLEEHSTQQVLDPVTRAFFQGVVKVDPTVRWVNGRVQTEDRSYKALLANTLSPTLLESGFKSNVIPPSATVNLNCRLLPAQDPDAFVDSLRSWIGSGPYEFDYTARTAPPPSSTDGAGYILIEQVCKEMFPRVPVLPYLSPGMSDAARLRKAGVATYGLLPFPVSEDDVSRMHGKDERLSVEALGTGVKLIYRLAELGGK